MSTMNYPRPYYNPQGTLFFLHLPKTGGMSLRALLASHFRDGQIYDIDPHDAAGSIKEFQALAEERRREIKLVCGHQPFGLHESVPAISTYLTFLRSPEERVLSFYSYARENTLHPLHDVINEQGLGIEDVLQSEHGIQMRNVQTQQISGWQLDRPKEALEWAKHHLRFHFCMVGIVERYAESVTLLRNVLGLEEAHIPSVNRTQKRMLAEELPDSTRNLIREANALDFELYDFAVELFELQVRQQGPSFPRDVEEVAGAPVSSVRGGGSGLIQRFLGKRS